jgi:hypothetical protein
MAGVRVRIGDFEDGAVPWICASSGEPADDLYLIRMRRAAAWAWAVALLFFPFGLIVLFLADVTAQGYLPFTHEAQRAMRQARRHALVLAGWAAGLGLLLTWIGVLVDPRIGLAALVAATVVSLLFLVKAARPAGSVGGRPDSTLRFVDLTHVHPTFAAAYERQVAVARAQRRAVAWQPAPPPDASGDQSPDAARWAQR